MGAGVAMKAETASFRIGPLTTYADPADMAAWIERAATGDEMIYATGPVLGEHPAASLARKMAECAQVELFQRRSGKPNCFDYCARRLPPAASVAENGEHSPANTASLEKKVFGLPLEEARVYQCIATAARAGSPCPSLARIATICRLKSRRRADYLLAQLVEMGLLKKHDRPANARRDMPMVFEVVLIAKTTGGERG